MSYPGEFVKTSVRAARPHNKIRKKKKSVAVLIRLKKEFYKKDRSFIQFKENNAVLLKKR